MTKYVITYDLKNGSSEYEMLYEYFQNFVHARINESCIVVASQKTNVEIRDDLIRLIGQRHYIFVANLVGYAAWNNSIDSTDSIKRVLNM